MSPSRLQSSLVCVIAVGLVLAGCGGDEEKPKPKASSNSTDTFSSPPPPSYTAEHIQRSLIAPKEVDADLAQNSITLISLRDRKIPICSLASIRSTGVPELTIRQFNSPPSKPAGANYGQYIARFGDQQAATTAYAALKKKLRACPNIQHVPPKRLPGNFVQFEHDDTWKYNEDSLAGWSHLRGFEKQVVSASQTKLNVSYLVYDYASRGNLVFASLYWQRKEPKQSGDPVAKRATEILTKQLQKLD